MAENNEHNAGANGETIHPDHEERRNAGRRRLLKQMGGGSAAVVATAFTDTWYKPVVNSVVLPAHAQTSPAGPTITGTVAFASNDTNNTPATAGPFDCGEAVQQIITEDADFDDLSINGITARMSPPGGQISLDVTGNMVNLGSANQTSQQVASDPVDGEASFASINFNADDEPIDADGAVENMVFTFSADNGESCTIQIDFTE